MNSDSDSDYSDYSDSSEDSGFNSMSEEEELLDEEERETLVEVAGTFVECASEDLGYTDEEFDDLSSSIEELESEKLLQLMSELVGFNSKEVLDQLRSELNTGTREDIWQHIRSLTRLNSEETIQLVESIIQREEEL